MGYHHNESEAPRVPEYVSERSRGQQDHNNIYNQVINSNDAVLLDPSIKLEGQYLLVGIREGSVWDLKMIWRGRVSRTQVRQ